ncbi:hypothetical protein CTEN210_06916 [Chaetoceros tenuissimus]|uniref:Uncharacterized protein n=1 Tax=Chaetoceros tenuissimus TaxID=426638 RepID=A0AAD3CSU7_9STRA|nr:hypothetical protein CTEN210_06916 [Chaetoceros tenuissimus]
MTSSVCSRAGYIIKFCGYPHIWKSQLMDCICLSTAEAEYYALSQAMRALIPVCSLLKEMCSSLDVPGSRRQPIGSSSCDISVIYCPTETQEADYLTKNLPNIGELVQGW